MPLNNCFVDVQNGQYAFEKTTTSLAAISALANSAGETYAAVDILLTAGADDLTKAVAVTPNIVAPNIAYNIFMVCNNK